MQVTELFIGTFGRIFSSSSILVILTLMFIISIRLYFHRRKKAYLSISISLIIVIVQYVFVIGIEVRDMDFVMNSHFISRFLQVSSFILINIGMFQLYNRSKQKQIFTYYIFGIVTLLFTAVYFINMNGNEDPSIQDYLFHSLWIELYLFLLIFLGFYLVSPFIGQKIKYQLGIIIYLIAHVAHVTNLYIFEQEVRSLVILEFFLPIIFYCIVFLFIFDRMVEMLQSVYNSAITDGLTGLFNRNFFLSKIEENLKRRNKISVAFFDIDNFKILNDTQGHQKGDQVLIRVAKILRKECEDIGIAGRYGGEELVILITDSSINMKDLTEKIRVRIQIESPVTVSVGYSIYTEGVHALELVKQADQAMYQSKRTGKNKVTRYI